jgi:hypothetical protein|tara:strand:+ start:889 stop:1059 length:171 start_codon:yes stop_codon:yes gene_type:complete
MSDLQMEEFREHMQNELADMTVNDFTNLIDKHNLGVDNLDTMFYELLEILVQERSK